MKIGTSGFAEPRHAFYLEHNLSEVFLVELSEFPETKLAKVREEDSSFLFHLALHVDNCNKLLDVLNPLICVLTLLLRGGQPQGLHGGQQVLNISTFQLNTFTQVLAGRPTTNPPPLH